MVSVLLNLLNCFPILCLQSDLISPKGNNGERSEICGPLEEGMATHSSILA